MARPQKPIDQPPPPDFSFVWGDNPLDDPGALDALAELLPKIRDRDAFNRGILGIAYWLGADLAEQKRADEPAVHKALAELEERIGVVQATLDGLGHDAGSALERRASRPQPQPSSTKKRAGGRSPWEGDCAPKASERFEFVRQMMRELTRWTIEARQGFPASNPRGRPSNAACEDAMRGLKALWRDQTGTEPTSTAARETTKESPFITFADEFFGPICRVHGVPMPRLPDLALKCEKAPE